MLVLQAKMPVKSATGNKFMTNNEESNTGAPPPRSGEIRWVQCKGYRCLAVLDAKGKWRCLATDEELNDIVKVYDDQG